nr:MAG TPA: hypothetical protein [Caudoviricetes sp.]
MRPAALSARCRIAGRVCGRWQNIIDSLMKNAEANCGASGAKR